MTKYGSYLRQSIQSCPLPDQRQTPALRLFAQIKEEFTAAYSEGKEAGDVNKTLIGKYYHDVEKEAMRRMILDEGVRLDGRSTTDIRAIWGEVDYLPGSHGSSIFTRGETQSLSSVTLGTKMDEKIIDNVTFKGKERFLLHYNFPPFSTGESKTPRGLSRREIGHGNLAHRALKRMIPEGFPYIVRIVSDILESNGSSHGHSLRRNNGHAGCRYQHETSLFRVLPWV